MITQTVFVIKSITKKVYVSLDGETAGIEHAHNFTDYKTAEETIKTLPPGFYQIEKMFVNRETK